MRKKRMRKNHEKKTFFIDFWIILGSPGGGRGEPGHPRAPPGDPRGAPGGTPGDAGSARGPPGGGRGTPGSARGRPGGPRERPGGPWGRPGDPRELPGGGPGSILGLFWSDFGRLSTDFGQVQNVEIPKNDRNPPVFNRKIIHFGRLVFVSVSLRGPRSPDGDARGPSIYIYTY